jgi:pimeloyl-ACP methyl ester carboxylesterase
LFRDLPSTIHAIAITQRGHGEAEKPNGNYGPRELAADLDAFMEAKGIPSAVIVGHSMGSFASQRFAIDHPDRVRGLILIGSFATCADNEGVKDFVNSIVEPLEDPIPRAVAAEFQSSTFSEPPPDWFYEVVVSESLKSPARVWKAACRAMIDTDHRSELSRIKAETLLIWGSDDGFFSLDEQNRLLASIPDSSLRICESVGHAPHWEMPKNVAADIAEFVSRVGAKQAAASRQGVVLRF